jgi:hypothetical protein
VADIPEHHSKQEREERNCEYSWIDLPVSGRSIRVNNLLERCCKLIQFEMRRWFLIRCLVLDVDEGRQPTEELAKAILGNPEMGDHDHFLVFEVVHVDISHELHFEEESVLFDTRAIQIDASVRWLIDKFFEAVLHVLFGDTLELLGIGDDCVYFNESVVVLGFRVGQRVFLCGKTIANPADFRQYGASTFKDNQEDGFVVGCIVFGGDVERVHQTVALGRPEDHLGESHDVTLVDDSGYSRERHAVDQFGAVLVALGVEDLPRPVKQDFVVLQIPDFLDQLHFVAGEFVQLLEPGGHLVLHFVEVRDAAFVAVLEDYVRVKTTLLLVLEEARGVLRGSDVHLGLPQLPVNDFQSVQALLAPSDAVRERLVEFVGVGVDELHGVEHAEGAHHVEGVLLGDLNVVERHLHRPEHRHGSSGFN